MKAKKLPKPQKNLAAPSTTPFKLAPHLSLAFIGLMFFIPFLQNHHQYPIPGFYTEWLAGVLGLAALTLLLQRRWWDQGFEIPLIALAPLLLFEVLLLQWFLRMSPYPQQIFLASLYLLWALALMTLGQLLKKELGWERIAQVLAWCLVIGGVLSAAVGILQHYQISSPFNHWITVKMGPAVYGNLAQANHFADYESLALASLLYLHARKQLPLVLALILGLLLLYVIALSGSRSSWLYFAAIIGLSGWWHYRERSAHSARYWYGALLILLGFIVAQLLAQWSVLMPASSTVLTSAERLLGKADEASGSIRGYLWHEAWEMFVHAPILGIGWEQFGWQHFAWLDKLQATGIPGWYTHAHNILLQLLSETGLAGTLALLVCIALWLYGKRHETMNGERWWLLCLLSILAIHSLDELPLWFAHFLGIAAFLLGAGEVRNIKIELPRLGWWAMIAIFVIGLGATVRLEMNYRQLEKVIAASQTGMSGKSFAEANVELMRIYNESLLAPYVDLSYAALMTPDENMIAEKLALNTRLMHFAPIGDVVFRQAILLAYADNAAEARSQMDRSLRAFPELREKARLILQPLAAKNPARFSALLEMLRQ